jgi:hypothetical protein
MTDDIKAFFDLYVEDIPKFDGAVLAKKYLSPYTVMSRDGDAWLCGNINDTIDYFQILLDKHRADGVTSCKYEDLDFRTIGAHCYLATVSWTMMDAKGKTVSHWRESYNMLHTESGLKIFTSIDH